MNFKFTSPIGRTLGSILADAKNLLRPNSIAQQRRIRSATQYPSQIFANFMSEDLPRNTDGVWSSPETTAKYVAEFMRLNNFRK